MKWTKLQCWKSNLDIFKMKYVRDQQKWYPNHQTQHNFENKIKNYQ